MSYNGSIDMKLVVISDTHSMHKILDIPEGDVLIHCGDSLDKGTLAELEDFNSWLFTLPHPHKIVIAGNHDKCFQKHPDEAKEKLTAAIYLKDSSVIINEKKFYGSPWTREFYNMSFMLTPDGLREKWALIDEDTDVLITHGPPMSVLDKVYTGEHVGCPELLKKIQTVAPSLHLFGHIHEGYGTQTIKQTTFVNASVNTVMYQPSNKPIVIDC